MFKSILFAAMGVFFMVGSFYMTGVRGGLSRGPGIPASRSHKVFLFFIGVLVFIEGLRMMVK